MKIWMALVIIIVVWFALSASSKPVCDDVVQSPYSHKLVCEITINSVDEVHIR